NPCATSTRGGTSSDTKAEEKHHVGSGAGAVAVPGGRARGLSSAGFPVGCATPVPLVRSLRFQPPPHRVKSTAGEVPLAGSFSVGLFPNRACKFPRTLLSSDHFGYGLVARPAWMSSWQRRRSEPLVVLKAPGCPLERLGGHDGGDGDLDPLLAGPVNGLGRPRRGAALQPCPPVQARRFLHDHGLAEDRG